MADLLADWWQVFVLVYLPQLAVMLTSLTYAVVTSRLDRSIPDTLPLTAGEWLREQLERDGPRHVRAIVTGGPRVPARDGYHPHAGIIQLQNTTYFKADPIYWAIAAHELGHARFRAAHPRVELALAVAGWMKWGLSRLGLGIIVGNILYGLPGVTVLGFQLLAAALVLDVLVLVEEAIASHTAARLLARHAVLSPRHLRAVRVTLFLAFCTYFAAFLSHAVLLSMWEHIVALTGAGRVGAPAGPLGSLGTAVVAVATMLGALAAVLRMVTLLSPDAARELVGHRRSALMIGALFLLERVFLLITLALVWDLRADPTYAWCMILAMIPAIGAIIGLVKIPLLLVYLALARMHRSVRQRHGVDRSPEFLRAEREGKAQVGAGNLVVAALAKEGPPDGPVRHRLGALVRLLYLPLLVVYWLT